MAIQGWDTGYTDYGVGTTQLQGNFDGGKQFSGGTGDADTWWNKGWNQGFNSPSTGYAGNDVNERAGYVQGQKDYWLRNPSKSSSNTGNVSSNPVPSPNNNIVGENPSPQPQQPQGPTAEQIRAMEDVMINDQYNSNNQFLNQQEGLLRGVMPGQVEGINQSYDLTKQGMDIEKDSTIKDFLRREELNFKNKEDVVSQARRLYNEMKQGSKQKFGGMTSAGEAVKELLGREFMSNVSGAKQTFQENQQQIFTKKIDFDKTYQNQVAQLGLGKTEALKELDLKFQSNLMDIMAQRQQNESWKRERQLASLKSYANEVRAVNERAQALQDEMSIYKQKMDLSFDNDLKMLQTKAAMNTSSPDPGKWYVEYFNGQPFHHNPTTGEYKAMDMTGIVNSSTYVNSPYNKMEEDLIKGDYGLNLGV